MKAKHLFGAFMMAVLGAVITLFVYTKYFDKSLSSVFYDNSIPEFREARALLTSFQTSDGQQVDFTYAAEQTVQGVVYVQTRRVVGNQSDNPMSELFGNRNSRPREQRAAGSGVIISADGYIITNNHVIENASEIEITLYDNRTMKAELVGRDPSTDIALLKIAANNLHYIRYGDSDALRLGEWVLAVGNPFSLTSTVTAGIVSAKGRGLRIINEEYSIESFIQTDAALNMGNSGGALVNTRGLLVGITTAILSPSGTSAGNAFAVPTSIVKKVVEDLQQFGEVKRAVMGVNIIDVNSEIAEKLKLDKVSGVLIMGVTANGAAAGAGLQEQDVIIAINDAAVNTTAELQEQVGRYRPSDRATVRYIRNGREQTASLTLQGIAGNNLAAADRGTDVVFGAKLSAISATEKRRINILNGVRIMEVNDGKFKDIGMREGYIILSINDRRVDAPSDVYVFTDNGSTLKSISGVQTNGTTFNYQFGN